MRGAPQATNPLDLIVVVPLFVALVLLGLAMLAALIFDHRNDRDRLGPPPERGEKKKRS